MTFTGIPIAALDFYEDLEADNSKSFWTAHKDVYEESVRAPLEALAAELADEFGPAKLFRPYRDVRFVKDKTPYKTQQGAWFAESSLYVAISAAGLFVAGGYWDTASDQVERMRRAVADDVAGAELERAATAVRKAGYTINGHQLTRVPSGYAKDHPRVEWLRYKVAFPESAYSLAAYSCRPVGRSLSRRPRPLRLSAASVAAASREHAAGGAHGWASTRPGEHAAARARSRTSTRLGAGATVAPSSSRVPPWRAPARSGWRRSCRARRPGRSRAQRCSR